MLNHDKNITIRQGHFKSNSWDVQLSQPDIGPGEIEAVTAVLTSGWLSLGPRLGDFEREFAAYTGVKHAIAVNSGTSALDLILKTMDIGPGDMVITTPFSFIASANCILFQDAIPVFVDVDSKTQNIDLDLVEAKIKEIRRNEPDQPKAILGVDVFGRLADWERLEMLAEEYDLKLIEDGCEALGAQNNGRRAGAFGDACAFGFYPNKQITTGEGGMITTDDDRIAERCRCLRNQGRSGSSWLAHSDLGYNYRLSDINCAIGLAQIRRVNEILMKRDYVAEMYGRRLADIPDITLPGEPDTGSRSWFVYVLFLDDPSLERDQVLAELMDHRIQVSNYFPPIHLQPLYRQRFGFREGDFPVTESLARRSVALPFYGNMGWSDVNTVAQALESVFGIVPEPQAVLSLAGEMK
ncbi:MAG: DegT/DnrJ/EryC1/StrS family aminotransferase [bacterium]|nr:DegT/DnrJ/EryC1/StrS family aminotransferase [bacterium]